MNWLKILVGISAILVAGCAAYFSITGLGVLFAGASISVMVMAGSLEFAKLVAATYLKQEWDSIKGFNKWYLTISVGTLMIITSAGIFGYLSNAFQQQNLELQKIERDIAVYQTQIDKNDVEIARYTTQLTNQQNIRNSQEQNISKVVERNGSTSRLTQMVRNADKEITSVSKRIDELSAQTNVALDSINSIKNNNIQLEREVGGFRFVAEAFNVPLNDVVKFFIFIIVLVFDPLAIALIIAFNGLIADKKKKQRKILTEMMENDQKLGLYKVYGDKEKEEPKHFPGPIALGQQAEAKDYELGMSDEELRGIDVDNDELVENNLQKTEYSGKKSPSEVENNDLVENISLSENDAEIFFNEINNPTEPVDALIEAKERYEESLKKKSLKI